MDYFLLLSIISGLITIISYFLPIKWRTNKMGLAILFGGIVFISGWITHLNSKLERVKNVQKSAMELVNRFDMEFTNKGFIQAGISFMEENKDLYPDSYQRAIQMKEDLKDKWFSGDVVDASYEMKGLIYGIAILNKDKK